MNGYIKEKAIPIALLVVILAGGAAWGQQNGRVNEHQRRIQQLEQTQEKIHDIDKKQAVMNSRMENMQREQRLSSAGMTRRLEEIMKRLNR